jgi:hypothetical protein
MSKNVVLPRQISHIGNKKGLCTAEEPSNLAMSEFLRQCLDPFKLPKNLQDFPSHRIFRHMHGALNVDKK